MGAVAPYAARNFAHLYAVSGRQRSIMVGEDVIVATINEFDKRIVKGIVTMMGTIIADTLDTEEQIEEAKASLDRINGWINSCDSKAGTVLALTGVLLTIIFTNDGVAEMYNVLQSIIPPANFCTVLYIGFLGISVFTLCYGIARLITTLIARIDANIYQQPEMITDSVLFFGKISDRASYQIFQNDILSIKKEDYLKDLLSQVYINSKIANEKYMNYNKGIKWTIIGFVAFIVMFLIGIFLY